MKGRRERRIDKNLNAIHERLIKEINYWSDRHEKLKADIAAGKNVRLTLENVRRMIDDLTARLDRAARNCVPCGKSFLPHPWCWVAHW